MAGITREYLKTIIPENMPDGRELLKEGMKIGESFEARAHKFVTCRGYRTDNEYIEATKNTDRPKRFIINVGMPTLETTVQGCVDLAVWARENLGVEVIGAILPSINVGVPPELRDPTMNSNAFMMSTQEDYDALNREDVFLSLGNHALAVPNALETTINCLKAGIPSIGTTSQLAWDYPGCEDHVENVANLVRSLGIMRAHMEVGPSTTCYTEDGLASSCVDTIGFIAYYLFEHYIYEELCGIPIQCGFGALCSDVKTKAALMVAVDSLKDEIGHSTLMFVHGSCTTQWDHDIEANFGSSLQEQLMMILTETKYKTGCSLLTVPITEALRVPTMAELKHIVSAAARMTEFADQWVDLIDWKEIEDRAEIIRREGTKMFHNMMDTLEELGLDMQDPMQLLMFIKRVDSALFEVAFHPSIRETGTFKPWFPNDMGGMTMEMVADTVEELKQKGYTKETLKGKKAVIGSVDTHSYGIRYVDSVLESFGCKVVDIGTDNSLQALLDTADEEGIVNIGISTHNGQALALADHLQKMIAERDRTYNVFMGGVLNTILPGHTEASDVTHLVEDRNIIGANDMAKVIESILAS